MGIWWDILIGKTGDLTNKVMSSNILKPHIIPLNARAGMQNVNQWSHCHIGTPPNWAEEAEEELQNFTVDSRSYWQSKEIKDPGAFLISFGAHWTTIHNDFDLLKMFRWFSQEIHLGNLQFPCQVRVLFLKYPLVNCPITNWKDPPFYSWVNQLFRLGHFQ